MLQLQHYFMLVALSFHIFCNVVLARHVHHPLQHIHVRQNATPTSIVVAQASTKAADAVVSDIDQLQDSLSSLPNDLLAFINALELQLQKAESLISSFLNTVTIPLPTSAALSGASVTTAIASSPTTPSLSTPSSLAPVLKPFSFESFSLVLLTKPASGHVASSAPTASLLGANATTSVNAVYTDLPSANFTGYAGAPSHASPTLSQYVGSSSAAQPTSTVLPSAINPSTSPSSSSAYTFNATSRSNVAVYYGQAPETQLGGLLALCESSDVDIVILAFVTAFFTPSGMPSASFGPACSGSTPAQQLHAPGLSDCSALAPEIAGCQSLGKKVLVSLGGSAANTTIPTAGAAAQLATNLWDLFGGGTGPASALRPFGPDVSVDGFDIDNEDGDTDNYYALAAALRSIFLSAETDSTSGSGNGSSKTYYLSAAPQCPYPDASIPLSALALADFVWVQFYNNPSCNLDAAGFQAGFAMWSEQLAAVSNFTRLFIGAGAFEEAGSGYMAASGLETRISLAREMYVPNFGGVMLWDGTQAMANVDQYGNDYLVYAKGSLE